MNGRLAPHLGLLAAMAIWGGAFVALKELLAPKGPLDWISLTWLRYASASVLLLAVALAVDPHGTLGLLRRHPGQAFLTGTLGVAAYNLALNYGESQIPATVALLIIPVNPVGTMLLAGLFLGERTERSRWIGSGLAILGLVGVVLAAPRKAEGWGERPGLGLLATLFAALAWSGYTLLAKSLTEKASPLAATAVSTALGTLPVLPFALGGPAGASWRRLASGGTLALGWMAYLVLLSTVAAFLLYLWGLKRLPAGRAASYIYLMPAFGLAWGHAVVPSERVSPLQLAGAALMVAGVAIASGRSRRYSPHTLTTTRLGRRPSNSA